MISGCVVFQWSVGTLLRHKESYTNFLTCYASELLNREIFYSLKEVQILTERWRREYNTIRPHSSLGYRPPVPETIMPRLQLVAIPR